MCAVILAACSQQAGERGADSSATSASSDLTFPAGTVPYASMLSGLQHGVYGGPAGQCCFIGGKATFTLAKPVGAHVATFHFYIPKVKPYEGKGLTMTVSGKGFTKTAILQAGSASIAVEIPKELSDSTNVPIQLTASPTFVPKALGMNGDDRTLSGMLLSVSYGG